MSVPSLETLKRLRPLSEFSTEQLNALAQQLNQKTAKKGEVLLELASTEDHHLFILYGEVELRTKDEQLTTMKIKPGERLNPLAQLRPSMYQITAKKEVEYLKFPKQLLTQFSSYSEGYESNNSVEIIESDSTIDAITISVMQDIMSDKLSLPSLPETALKIQAVYQNDLADINSISDILIIDPAITAKLIKVANSVVYQGRVATETLKAAITRLGIDTTYKQVMAYAVNDLFKCSSPTLKNKMTHLWQHSRKVAAISRLLAEETELFDPDLALLAGLVHDLGVIVILEYLEQHHLTDEKEYDVSKIVSSLRPVVTGMLMKKWNFTEETITVAEECEDWFRNKSDEVDLCDLIMIAQYHSYIGTEEMNHLPRIDAVPAMKKLNFSPADSIALIKSSKNKIKAMEEMLR